MSQHPPSDTDATVRYRGDGPDGRPPLEGVRQATGTVRAPVDTRPPDDDVEPAAPAPPADPPEPERASDDTRPVHRDRKLGAPDARPPERTTPPGPGPAGSDVVDAADATRPAADQDAAPTAADPAGKDPPADPDPGADDVGTERLDLTEPAPVPAGSPAVSSAGARTAVGGEARPGPSDPVPAPGDDAPRGARGAWWRRRAVLVPAGAVAVLAAVYGIDLAVAQGSIPRSTVVAGVDIGGLSPAAAATTLERELGPRISAERTVVADDVEASLSPAAAGLSLDVDRTVDAADDQPLDPWTRLVTLFAAREVTPVVEGDDTALGAQLESIAALVDRAPVDATIAFEGTTPSVVDAADGRALDREGAAEALTESLATGEDPGTPVELPVEVTPVRVDRAEAERVLEETVLPAVSAPVAVVSEDGATSAEVPVAAIAASLAFTPEDDGELAVSVDPAALQAALGEELSAFGTPARDADVEVSGGAVSIVPSADGTGVDPARLAEQLLPVLTDPAPRSVTAELGPVPADFTTEEAQALGIKEEISSFTTRFTNPASGTNIRVVAEEVDGALVLPGETFSLNTFTGPRGTAQGYVEAPVIQNGELSKAVGGGISQFATTMFNAVFFAGLEDVFHKPHTFYISRYPAGREATVYEGAIDLQWRNDSDTGVYIDTTWVPGAITVTFYGTKRYEIEAIEGPRTNHREPPVQDKVDDGNCTTQPGIPGFDVTVTRIFRDLASGAELRREAFETRYAAEAIINCIPPAAPPTPGG